MAMTPEEYEQFKEAEKAHLRKLRELKKTHAQLQRKAKVTRAVTDMAEGISSLYNEHEEMVEKLQQDSFGAEARMEVALDNLSADDAALEKLDAAELEADQSLRKARAQELIRQMKQAEGSSDPAPTSSSTAASQPKAATPDDPSPSDLPEKTIGRMRR
ncbi:MAG: hypothetical protein OXT73_02105 [Bacteroidota bacterium]|nr:hypothetical protein [Bacteroidota bacterium]